MYVIIYIQTCYSLFWSPSVYTESAVIHLARKSNGWLIVSLGPSGYNGKLARTVRETEGPGVCDYCRKERKKLFSYADDNIRACNKTHWVAAVLMDKAGVRRPTPTQVAITNEIAQARANKARLAQRKALPAGVSDMTTYRGRPTVTAV